MDRQLLKTTIQNLIELALRPSENALSRHAIEDIRLDQESTVITGVRRCGKSFAMRSLARKLASDHAIFFLDFDDPRLTNFTALEFETAYNIWLSEYASPPRKIAMFFDEPQVIEGWEKWINHFASKENHLVVLTGSNSKLLSSELATFLTGRHRVVNLTPFSFAELWDAKKGDSISTQALLRLYLQFGGFPRVWISQDLSLLGQYFKDIVLKDISTRKGAAPARVNIELGLSLMTQASKLVNKTRLAEQLGFRQARTINQHIHAFIHCYLFSELRLFSPSLKRQQRSLPKFYPVDHALARATRFTVFDDQSFALECLVANEFIRRGYEIYYWQSKDNYEVDFIARKLGKPLIAVQVCLDLSNKDTQKREIRALLACAEELRIEQLMIITEYDERMLDRDPIRVVSFTNWALERES